LRAAKRRGNPEKVELDCFASLGNDDKKGGEAASGSLKMVSLKNSSRL
jgi:hypothetical protein